MNILYIAFRYIYLQKRLKIFNITLTYIRYRYVKSGITSKYEKRNSWT